MFRLLNGVGKKLNVVWKFNLVLEIVVEVVFCGWFIDV